MLHHGFGADAEVDWVRTGTVDALVAAGRRVVALDARGHGRSDAPHDPACYGEPRMARDVSTLLADDPATVADARAAGFRAFVDSTGADRSALAAHVAAVNREPLPLGAIRVPTLVLAGRDDEVAVRPHVLGEAIPGAQGQLVDGDHGQALRDPGFLAALVAFLTDVPGDATGTQWRQM